MKKSLPFFYGSFLTPIGTAIVGWHHDHLSAFVLPQPSFDDAFRILNSYQLPHHDSKIARTKLPWPDLPNKINAYFQGEAVTFAEPVFLDQFKPFTRQVLDFIRSIPWGGVMTYQQVALLSTQTRASRAVGQALGRNPIPLIIPCHRVIAKNSLGGFGFGLEWKSRMLSLEKFQTLS